MIARFHGKFWHAIMISIVGWAWGQEHLRDSSLLFLWSPSWNKPPSFVCHSAHKTCTLQHRLAYPAAEPLPCEAPSPPSPTTCQLRFPLNTGPSSDLSSTSRGLDTLLLFLLAGIDFPWYYTLQDYYCPPGCPLCNANTGCCHNSPLPSRVTNTAQVMRLAGNPQLISASKFVAAL